MSAKYTLSSTHDNLSTTFSDDGNNNFNLGYLDAFDPMLDWGYAQFDSRHRLALSGVWVLPVGRNASGLTKALISDWQLNWILTARTGYPFTLWDCTNGLALCMRAQNPDGLDLKANGSDGDGECERVHAPRPHAARGARWRLRQRRSPGTATTVRIRRT